MLLGHGRLQHGENCHKTVFIEMIVRHNVGFNMESRRVKVFEDDLGRSVCFELARRAALRPMRQRQNRMPGRRTIDNDIGNRINLRISEKPHPRLASETLQGRLLPDGLFHFRLDCGFRMKYAGVHFNVSTAFINAVFSAAVRIA